MIESTNDILSILNDRFDFKLIELVGIDGDEILLCNDDFGIAWDIITSNIRIYQNGLEIAFLSKINIYNDLSKIDIISYERLINNLILAIDQETLNDIKKELQKYIIFEEYENAQKLKNFLDQFI